MSETPAPGEDVSPAHEEEDVTPQHDEVVPPSSDAAGWQR